MPRKNAASNDRSTRATARNVGLAKPGKPAKSAPTKRPVPAAHTRLDSSPAGKFFVVGIGASAGGLEALEQFCRQVPADSGMAFVIVTHQHPGHTSLLPELLRRYTGISVAEAEDGVRVRPNCMYLSRPGDYLTIGNGALRLVEFKESGGLHLPIDHFFHSLAKDQGERAVGIVLSGNGADGTLGLKAIKEAGGMAIAQEPQSAKYAGMPESAIASGAVDHVLRPERMPQNLVACARDPGLLAPETVPTDGNLSDSMQAVLGLLHGRTGHDFTSYKVNTLRRRIERRMSIHRAKGPPQYLAYLRENPGEIDLLFKELLIGVTNFFRDAPAFDVLAKKILPEILDSRADDSPVRVWVPGCSTGEEVYSLAILLVECMERLKKRFNVQIFGTDLDGTSIERARAGVFPEEIKNDVARHRLARFFIKEDATYRVRKEVREMVVFATQNVLGDPPFTRLDLLACRNLLIYVKAERQKRLLTLFHYALKPDGVLFLGPSETVGEFGHHFVIMDKKWKIYRREDTVMTQQVLADFPTRAVSASAASSTDPATRELYREPRPNAAFEKLLLRRFSPASVIVNERGDISYIHGRTGDYLEPSPGQPRLNALEMAREGLRLELASLLRRAAAGNGKIVQVAARVRTNGKFSVVDVAALRITEPESLRGLFLVTFRSAAPVAPATALRGKGRSGPPVRHEQELERELQHARESLQHTVEELETSNEELKSTNEELQSTNEELQSTNEELETSKEEMQSLNEELQTVNVQLQTKVEALSQASDDMQNLLNGTSIATIFLDDGLRIKRFTEQARSVVNLIAADVGRPIGDLVSNLDYRDFAADAFEVLRTLVIREREVQTRSGDWGLVRILPYRTTENVIDGLVITFVDITRIKRAELAAQARVLEECIVATVREPMLVLDASLRVVAANKSFCRLFGVDQAAVVQQLVYEIGGRQWDIPRLRELLEEILPANHAFEDFEVEHDFAGIGRRVLLLNARRLEQQGGQPGLILLAMEDVTGKPQPSGTGSNS